MKTLVMKFGGTSVGGSEAIQQTAAIVQRHSTDWDRLVVVVSAMRGITDALIACAQAAVCGDRKRFQNLIADMHMRHRDVLLDLIPDGVECKELLEGIQRQIAELSAYIRSIQVLGEITPRGMDTIVSFGERMNARLVAAALRQSGLRSQAVDATELIVTDGAFQNAVPDMVATRKKTLAGLLPLLDEGIVPVVTGFIGATPEGVITTLGRGGSDYTAAILGSCLDADEVWTWTDVDGVMTADPRIVPEAQVIPEISFREISELAYFGAKVLHPKAIRPVMEKEIPLWVKNTFNPENPGTCITSKPPSASGRVIAISTIPKLSLVTVEGRGMLGVPGIAARTFAAVARTGASVLMISQASSEQSICFVIPAAGAEQVICSLEEEMALELSRRDIDRVWQRPNVTILTVVGSALRETPGVAARIFGALGQANINVVAIAQGSSEYIVSLVVADEDAEVAVHRIHDEVILS